MALQGFISYAHTDRKQARDIKAELKKFGINCFLAHEDLKPAVAWADEMKRQFEELQAFHRTDFRTLIQRRGSQTSGACSVTPHPQSCTTARNSDLFVIPEDIIPAEVQEPYSMAANSLVRDAGPLWDEATRSPFLDALAAGGLTADAFRRWLAQDYLFAKELLAFQAILLAKAPRDCHKPLIEGLAALGREMEWFETHAASLQVNLDIPPHPTCRRYADFLIRCVYTQPYPVLLAILFGVEASYLAAWSALLPSGPYAEFIERWSGADFVTYVAVLGGLAERHPYETAQEHFNEVLVHEREFWKMSWEG